MRLHQTLISALAGALLAATPTAVPGASGDLYQEIAQRNLFGLRPLPPPVVAPEPERPLPKLTLTGISTILGKKLAFLKAAFPAKPGEAARDQSYMLAVGQRDGELEIIQIDEKSRLVTVENSGTRMTLTFDKDSLKSAPGPNIGSPPTGSPAPPFIPGPGLRSLPIRNPHPPIPNPAAPVAAAPGIPPPNALASSATPTTSQAQSNLSPEEQTLLQGLEEVKY